MDNKIIPEFYQSKPDRLGVPSKLIIQGYQYSFKDKLKIIDFLINTKIVVVVLFKVLQDQS